MKRNLVVGEVDPSEYQEPPSDPTPINVAKMWQWDDPEPRRTRQSKLFRGVWQYHHTHKRTWPASIHAHPRTLSGVDPAIVDPIPMIEDDRLPEGIIFFAHKEKP